MKIFINRDGTLIAPGDRCVMTREETKVVPAVIETDGDGNQSIAVPATVKTSTEEYKASYDHLLGMPEAELARFGIAVYEASAKPNPDYFVVTGWEVKDGVFSWLADSKPLDEFKAREIRYIKSGASGLIEQRFPLWKQMNMISRGVELQDIARRNGAWTEDEAAEAGELQLVWDWIKAIRSHSNSLEAEVNAIQTVEELVDWRSHDWPEYKG